MPEILCGCCGAKGGGSLCSACGREFADITSSRKQFIWVCRAAEKLSRRGECAPGLFGLERLANMVSWDGVGFPDPLEARREIRRGIEGIYSGLPRAKTCTHCRRRFLVFDPFTVECFECAGSPF